MFKLILNSSMMRMKLQLTEKLDLKDTTQREQKLLKKLPITTISLNTWSQMLQHQHLLNSKTTKILTISQQISTHKRNKINT